MSRPGARGGGRAVAAAVYLLVLAVGGFLRGAIASVDSLGELGDSGVWATGQKLHLLHRNRPDEQPTGLSSNRRSLLQGKGELRTGDRDRALWDAAAAGDVDALRKAIKAGGDVETKQGAFGDTPLTIAAARGHIEVMKVLLEEEADPDVGDLMYDAPPVWWGAQENHLDVVQLLIDEGADVNRADNMNITAIEVAAQNGNAEIVELLLAAGADAGHSDDVGDTALHFASVTLGDASVRIIQALLKAGAPVNFPAADGTTPLMWAVEFGNVAATRVLVNRGAAVGQEDHAGETAADKICKCLDFAGKDNLLQCPKGGCDKEGTVKKIRNILKK